MNKLLLFSGWRWPPACIPLQVMPKRPEPGFRASATDANPCSRTAPCKTFTGASPKTATTARSIASIRRLRPPSPSPSRSRSTACSSRAAFFLRRHQWRERQRPVGAQTYSARVEIHGGGTGNHGVNVITDSNVTIDKCFLTAMAGNAVNVRWAPPAPPTSSFLDTVITQTTTGINLSRAAAELRWVISGNHDRKSCNGIVLQPPIRSHGQAIRCSHGKHRGVDRFPAAALSSTSSIRSSRITPPRLKAAVERAVIRCRQRHLSNAYIDRIRRRRHIGSSGDNKIDPAGPGRTHGRKQ